MQFVDQTNVTSDNDPERDVPNQRLIHTRFGFTIKLERRDPYGFVHVVWPKGPVPEIISGAYSDFTLAKQAVNNYIESNTFNKIVEEPPVLEKAVYKKRFRNAESTREAGKETGSEG